MITVSWGPCDSPAVKNRSVMWAASYLRPAGILCDRGPGRLLESGAHDGERRLPGGPDLERGGPLVEQHAQAVDGPGAGRAGGQEPGRPAWPVDQVHDHLAGLEPPRFERYAPAVHADGCGVDDQVDRLLGQGAVQLVEGDRASLARAEQAAYLVGG